MFRKILIANRGEIACRIIRACRDLRIGTVAVYSSADSDALHVRMADEALLIGEPPSAESYLRWEKIIEAAKTTGAEAIHPGYGFLSENAEFVRRVIGQGLVFIGPPPEAMEAMGGKISARKIALAAGVPVVPGTNEPLRNAAEANEFAREFGFPVMLKAASGGGGKGMRLVENETDMKNALDAAQSEALNSFGDASVYVEKAVARPRHIEIQVFSDTHGNFVHLGERECSVQRRHQKVVEECPSPIGDADLRFQMGEAAIKIAKAVDYVGAGTVEFLVSDVDRSYYFLEMNTRLQVEHPVTELVTGVDIVCEQIRVAAGEKLSFSQEEIGWNSHAIECRVYAEDPANDFLPSPGRITRLRVPQGPGVRDDGGVYQGAEVSIHYDPLISKLVCYGKTRKDALDKLRRALREYEISGIKTTLPFFREIVEDREFIEGRLDTGFIPRFNERKTASKLEETTRDLSLIAAALAYAGKRSGPDPDKTPGLEIDSRWAIAGRMAAHRSRI